MLKYITLPHVCHYERRWVRRLVIVLTFPLEIARAIYVGVRSVCIGAVHWWRQP
jgi:hypothetical protein